MILCICGLVTQFLLLQSHNWSIMLGDYQSGRLDKPDTTGFFGWMYMESPKARGWSEDEYFCYKEQFKERCLNELLAGKPQATPIIVYLSHLVSIHQATIRLSMWDCHIERTLGVEVSVPRARGPRSLNEVTTLWITVRMMQNEGPCEQSPQILNAHL